MIARSTEGADAGWERADLLQRAWELDAKEEPGKLAGLLSALPETEILAEPELGFLLARSWRHIGERDRSLELVRRLAEPFTRLGNTRLARRRMYLEGILLFDFGQLERARELYLTVLEDSMRAGDAFTEGAALSALGSINSLLCNFPEALALYQRVLVLDMKLSRRGVAIHLNSIATTYREMGFVDEADANLQRSLEVTAESGDHELHAFAGVLRAQLMAQRGDTRLATESAARLYEHLKRERDDVDPFREADMLQLRAEIARRDGRITEARQLLERAREIASRPGVTWILADVWAEAAQLELADHRRDAAVAAASEAARVFRTIGAEKRARIALASIEG